jgi:protoporphyrinogen IX oxidase
LCFESLLMTFAAMTFLYLKAIHIVFIVTWFAGLFYMPRLMVYITEAHTKNDPERTILLKQLNTMASRLWYGITWPSALLTLLMGAALLIDQPEWLQYGFMHIKLTLVLLLYGYHFSLHYLMNQMKKGIVKFSSQQLRIWNEVATLFLIAIVFLIVLKSALSMFWGVVGLLIVTLLILLGIRSYKKFRDGKQD